MQIWHTILFADGLKEFRRAHDINDNVIIQFFAASKDTSFDVGVMGPIHRRRRSVVTTRRHIFIADVTQEMMEHNNPLVGVCYHSMMFLFFCSHLLLVQITLTADHFKWSYNHYFGFNAGSSSSRFKFFVWIKKIHSYSTWLWHM